MVLNSYLSRFFWIIVSVYRVVRYVWSKLFIKTQSKGNKEGIGNLSPKFTRVTSIISGTPTLSPVPGPFASYAALIVHVTP
jgi:hypothetical protein